MLVGAHVCLTLPDHNWVMQRRDWNAPTAAGKLALFGGEVEIGETPLQGAQRELCEETSLNLQGSDLTLVGVYDIPDSADISRIAVRAHVFRAVVATSQFKVFEGVRAEEYSLPALRARRDVSYVTSQILQTMSKLDMPMSA